MEKIFENWYKKEKLDLITPYDKKILKQSFMASIEDEESLKLIEAKLKEKLLAELIFQIDEKMVLYPINGVAVPALTIHDLKELHEKILSDLKARTN